MGATIVDALDTLIIMNMTEEAKKARDWISTNLDFDQVGRFGLEGPLMIVRNHVDILRSRQPCPCSKSASVSSAVC